MIMIIAYWYTCLAANSFLLLIRMHLSMFVTNSNLASFAYAYAYSFIPRDRAGPKKLE